MDVRRSHIGAVATPPGIAKLPGAPHQRGASYLPTKREGGRTYIPRKHDDTKIKRKGGAPMGTPPVIPLQIAASASNETKMISGL